MELDQAGLVDASGTPPPLTCQNCGRAAATRLSFDLDLPAVVLCGLCSLAIVADPELFDELDRRERRRDPGT